MQMMATSHSSTSSGSQRLASAARRFLTTPGHEGRIFWAAVLGLDDDVLVAHARTVIDAHDQRAGLRNDGAAAPFGSNSKRRSHRYGHEAATQVKSFGSPVPLAIVPCCWM